MPRGSSKGRPLTTEAELAILDAYESGSFIRDIVRKQRRALKTVHRVLDAAGLRGGQPVGEADL